MPLLENPIPITARIAAPTIVLPTIQFRRQVALRLAWRSDGSTTTDPTGLAALGSSGIGSGGTMSVASVCAQRELLEITIAGTGSGEGGGGGGFATLVVSSSIWG
ncbi:MAG TPA: hypothetical protein VFT22_04300 [Kofleriaceae bacterium]|nr:hypothetical protein [Kofleriaceae bacterium]